MKTRKYIAIIAAAIALVSCTKENVVIPALSVDTEEISITSDPTAQTFIVTANTTWTATVDQAWAQISSTGRQIYDGKAERTAIAVKVNENWPAEDRTAYITLVAEGVEEPVVVEVFQSAHVPEIQVFDIKGNPATDIECDCQTNGAIFTYRCNVSWSVYTDSDWIEAEKFNIQGNEFVAVAWRGNADDNSGRIGTVTFAPDGGTPVKINIAQSARVPFTAEVDVMLPSEYFGKESSKYPDYNTVFVYMGNTSINAVGGYYYLTTKKAAQTLIDNWDAETVYTVLSKAGYELDEEEDIPYVNEKEDPENIWLSYWDELDAETEYAWLVALEDEFGRKYAAYDCVKTAALPWEYLGQGKFQDGFFCDFFTGLATKEISVEIYYDKSNSTHFAVKNPYGPEMLGNGWMFNLTPEALEQYKGVVWYDKLYEFYIYKDNSAYVPYQTLGFCYYGESEGGMHPTYSATATATFANNEVTISNKGAVLNVPKYGMAYANKTDNFKITMPTAPTAKKAASKPSCHRFAKRTEQASDLKTVNVYVNNKNLMK